MQIIANEKMKYVISGGKVIATPFHVDFAGFSLEKVSCWAAELKEVLRKDEPSYKCCRQSTQLDEQHDDIIPNQPELCVLVVVLFTVFD